MPPQIFVFRRIDQVAERRDIDRLQLRLKVGL
jgi:hypothetical protein